MNSHKLYRTLYKVSAVNEAAFSNSEHSLLPYPTHNLPLIVLFSQEFAEPETCMEDALRLSNCFGGVKHMSL